MYHIYENICFLDVRYNVDDDVKTLKHNKKIGEEQEEFDIIPLRDYLKSKRYDNKQKRRFRDRKNKSNDPIVVIFIVYRKHVKFIQITVLF